MLLFRHDTSVNVDAIIAGRGLLDGKKEYARWVFY